jgi:hypothetical protein
MAVGQHLLAVRLAAAVGLWEHCTRGLRVVRQPTASWQLGQRLRHVRQSSVCVSFIVFLFFIFFCTSFFSPAILSYPIPFIAMNLFLL